MAPPNPTHEKKIKKIKKKKEKRKKEERKKKKMKEKSEWDIQRITSDKLLSGHSDNY